MCTLIPAKSTSLKSSPAKPFLHAGFLVSIIRSLNSSFAIRPFNAWSALNICEMLFAFGFMFPLLSKSKLKSSSFISSSPPTSSAKSSMSFATCLPLPSILSLRMAATFSSLLISSSIIAVDFLSSSLSILPNLCTRTKS